jgi:hypothetical protein
MPFVPSLPLMLDHLQPDNDPVRAAGEAIDPIVAQRLVSGWDELATEMGKWTPDGVPGEGVLGYIGHTLSGKVLSIAQDLSVARALGHAAMARRIAAEINKASLGFSFGQLASPVQEEADAHAAQFVREIGEDTRATLAAAIQRGVREGLPPRETARLMRESVGLTTSQAAAVQNYRRLLETGSPEALQRALRDQRFDVEPADLMKLTPDQIDARVDAYRRRFMVYRANTIARYETLQASNAGGMSAVQSAVQTGTLPPTTRKIWQIAKDEITCQRCRSIPHLQPKGVGLDDPFRWHAGKHSGEIQFAPLHPNCRCTNAYRTH